MSNRPVKKKKKVVEITQDDFDVEWTPPPRTARDRLIQFGVVFLILAFLLPAVTCAVTPTPETDPQQQQQQQDEVEMSIQRFSKDLAANPNDPGVLANLGYYTNIKASRVQDEAERMTLLATSEKYLRDSLAQDPGYAFAQAELAKNLMLQDKNEEAAELIQSGLEAAESEVDSEDEKTAADAKARKVELLRLSSTLDVRAGRNEEAIEKLNEVVEMKPGDPILYMARAELHTNLGNEEAALEDYNTVVTIGQQTNNQRMVMMGQMMIEQLTNPAPAATPGAEATPSAAATAAPAPAATAAPEPAVTPAATPDN